MNDRSDRCFRVRAPLKPLATTRGTLLVAAIWVIATSGCGPGQGPARSPAEAAAAALDTLDADQDGKLTHEELKDKCGSLLSAFERFDADGDQHLTGDEIADRIEYWRTCGTEIMLTSVLITLDGRPLANANLELTPEPFLGPGYKPCRGKTSPEGTATLFSDDTPLPGAYLGLYRMQIASAAGGPTLPARFTAESTLGLEIADDLPGVGQHEFHLRSAD